MNPNLKNLKAWISEPSIDPQIKKELLDLEEHCSNTSNYEEINDRFYKDMEFGTGGLRGKIGAGTNRMNVHTVRRVSQAYSLHLLKKYNSPSVVIAHDNRLFSKEFTMEAANVYSANGIKVYLFDELTPTPMLSYAVRSLKCSGGVVITASHNPREYNGYKIYDYNGCQCLPDEALEVSKIMDDIDFFSDVKIQKKSDLIKQVPTKTNESYYNLVLNHKVLMGDAKNTKIVYTPLNGAGGKPVTRVLKDAGIKTLELVSQQMEPDPDFTTCPKPNPEEDEALTLGLNLCQKLTEDGKGPDVLIATDPDCDRVGIVVNVDGTFERIDGNQLGVLLFDFVLTRLNELDLLPDKPVMITTIVSTPMAEIIGHNNQIKRVHVDKVLTGFKYIGGKIAEYELKNEDDRFIFGFEESCGYLAGTFVRDKDAISTSLLIAEMIGYYKKKKLNLKSRLNELYEDYGYFITNQLSIEESGEKGAKRINKIMDSLREPQVFTEFNRKVVLFKDYEEQTKRTMGRYDDEEGGCSMAIGTRPIIGLPKENVLEFELSNRAKAIIRPSGTEPKIKIYFSSFGSSNEEAQKNIDEIQHEFIEIIRRV